MTFQEVITSGLRMIGQYGPGQAPSEIETAQALFILNRMLRAWAIDKLTIFRLDRQFFTLTAGEVDFTIGDVSDRPVRIERASYTTDAGVTEDPIEILDAARYAAGEYGIYYDRSYPNGTIYLRPAADGVKELILYVWAPLGQVEDAADTVEFPQGYEEAVTFNLATRLHMEWRKSPNVAGTDISDVRAIAKDSLAKIKAFNAPSPILKCDAAVLGRGGFNILTGDSN